MSGFVALQFAAAIIIGLTSILFFTKRKLNFKDDRLFTVMLILGFCTILSETALAISGYLKNEIGTTLSSAAAIVYCILFSVFMLLSVDFICLKQGVRLGKRAHAVLILPVVLELVLCFVFPIQMDFLADRVCFQGIPVNVNLIITIIYMLIPVVFQLRFYWRAKRNTRIIAAWVLFNLIIITLLVAMQGGLLWGFAAAANCIGLFCALENPERNLDFSTEAFNRNAFSGFLENRVYRRSKFAIIAFSLREFAMLTDVFGNKAVNEMLTQIFEFCEGIADCKVFRIENNLFCVGIDNCTDAKKISETILERFDKSWDIGGLDVSVKAGIICLDNMSYFSSAAEIEEAITFFAAESWKKEDAKILYLDELSLSKRQAYIDMQHQLERAFSQDEIEVYFQPIYDVKGGHFTAMEALARIKCDDGKILSAEEFISYAEESGRIIKLGEVIFTKVCEFLQYYHPEKYGIEFVSVNMSLFQCMQENMAERLNEIMGEYGISPHRISFEIREDAISGKSKAVENTLLEVTKYGAGIILDRYGAGFTAGLTNGKQKLQIVKLDGILIKAYLKSEYMKAAVDSTVKMLHSLGYAVVAEGVETKEEYTAFKELGVEYIQGHFFSMALSKDKILKFIQEWL